MRYNKLYPAVQSPLTTNGIVNRNEDFMGIITVLRSTHKNYLDSGTKVEQRIKMAN